MVRILASACLLGEAARYDGRAAACASPLLLEWQREGRLVPFCPEVAGGLGVPRSPAEQTGGGVRTAEGHDVTAAFLAGARRALAAARATGARIAILKEGSPSCGPTFVHDGTFSATLRPGEGITAALLRAKGIEVFGEDRLDCAAARLRALERHLP